MQRRPYPHFGLAHDVEPRDVHRNLGSEFKGVATDSEKPHGEREIREGSMPTAGDRLERHTGLAPALHGKTTSARTDEAPCIETLVANCCARRCPIALPEFPRP